MTGWTFDHRMKTATPCPVDPNMGHEMWILGRSEQHAADLLACPCGLVRIGITDEHRERFA